MTENASTASNSSDGKGAKGPTEDAGKGKNSSEASAPPSLSAIAELLKGELRPVNTTMQKLESQMSNLSIEVNEKFKVLENKIQLQDVRVAKLEEMLKSGPSTKSDGVLEREIEKLREEVNVLKSSKTDQIEEKEDRNCTAVFSGLLSAQNIAEVKKWMCDQFWVKRLPHPENVYVKRISKVFVMRNLAIIENDI